MEDFSSLSHISVGLTPERLSKDLSSWFHEDLTFSHWEYVGDTGKGDSYMSDVMRIKIYGKSPKGETKNIQVILKNIPKNDCRRLSFRSGELFKNEIIFYTQVLPELLKFQATKDLKEPFDNYTKLFSWYIDDGITDYLILEDVSLHNYGSPVRQEGIDLAHCKVTLKTFAKFHAMSFAMKDQEPREFERIRSCLFETYYHEDIWPWYEKFWARLCAVAIDAVEKEYPKSIYLEKIKQFATPDCYKKMIDAATNSLETGVISHGDSWTNNFLYKYVDDVPVGARMIDFQLSRCASPVLDLSFFFYACTSQDMRLKHYDELLKYYYEVLSRQIDEMGSDSKKVYSWERFMEEVKKYSFFGLAFSLESTPFIVLDPEDAFDMTIQSEHKEKLNIEVFWPVKPFKTKEGRLREANNIVHCVDNGYI